jgi:hypothetical protein
VSAEDQAEPIIAFVEKGRFDPSLQNPLGALISRDMPVRMARARAQGSNPMRQANRNKWQKLAQNAAGGVQPSGVGVGGSIGISDLRVAPFINTLWDQGDLYTTVSNIIWVTNTVSITTHFVTNALNDITTTSVGFTNTGGTLIITNGPGYPVNYWFGGQSVSVDVNNGPDSKVTNSISVTVTIRIVFTNEFGKVIANQVLVGNGVFSDIATGSTGTTVTHSVLATIGIPMVVSDSKACYNYFTPPHEPRNTDNDVCGCVATAMAQLMYYFQCPSTNVGTPCFTVTVNGNSIGYNLRGGNGKGGPYDWNDMPLAPDYYSLSQTQAQAVGALTRDAGVAIHMQYTASASEAYMTDAKAALVSTFQYNNAIVNSVTNLDTGCFECSLYNMMNPNLDARLPVLLGITGDPGGHAIVVDGYGYCFGALYHHLNLGWSGAYNAWYQLPIIDMEQPDGSYVYFWNVTECIYNVFTNGSGEIISGRVLDDSGDPITGASVTAVRVGGGTYQTVTDTNGIYALVGVPSASTYTLTVTNMGCFSASSSYSTTTSSDSGSTSGNIWGADFTLVLAQGAPVITQQPVNQIVDPGTTVTFSVSATGALPLTYQWQSCAPLGSYTNLIDGVSYSGSGTQTLTVNQAGTNNNGQPFQCIVTNTSGATTSAPAVLIVNIPSYLTITTLAGLAGTGGSTDGTNNTALFNNPRGIAVDNNTNVYVTDLYNQTIRKLTPSGTNWVVSTIAGLAGSSGSADGTNSNARFNGPYGITVDGGNLYVADTGNHTIRKLTPSGTNWVVSTIAGLAGSSGSTDSSNSYSRFRYPMGIAMGGGNLYVTDEGNSTIRKLTSSGTNWVASTLAGLAGSSGSTDGTNNNARFNGPYGIAVNGTDVYVADRYNSTIRKLIPVGMNWVVTTIAGNNTPGSTDGGGSAARFNNPTGIAVDAGGNLYVADEGNNTIRRLTLVGTNWVVFTAAGLAGSSGSADGSGSAVRFNNPYAIAVDASTNVYVADSINNTIRGVPLFTTSSSLAIQIIKQKTGDNFTLAWSATVGCTYQVQFKTNLSQTAWYTFTNVTAPNWTGSASIPVGPDPQRFYRVIPLQ